MITENEQLYISWRDSLLKMIGENICQKCTDPRKKNITINIEDPLNCECRCERVNDVLSSAAKIDHDINFRSNSEH